MINFLDDVKISSEGFILKKKKKRFYVYGWFNNETGELIYVGKGNGKRLKQTSGRNDKFTKYVKKYKCTPQILWGGLDEETALEKEKDLIALFRKQGMAKCNFLDGGDTNPRLKGADNPRSRPIIQLSKKGEFIKRFACIDEASRLLNGVSPPIIRSLKSSRYSAYGYRWIYESEYDQEKNYYSPDISYGKKCILQFTITGEFLKEWESIKEASKEMNCTNTAIIYCLKGKTKSCKGFIWKYKNEA